MRGLAPLGLVAALFALQDSTLSRAADPSLSKLIVQMRAARVKGDVNSWAALGRKVVSLAPDHPDLLISAARALSATGDKNEAIADLAQATARGAGFDPARFPEFKLLLGDARFQEVARRARANAVVVRGLSSFARLPSNGSEGIAFDPRSKRLLVGTNDGRLLSITPKGEVSTLASGNGLREILGVKVDAIRRIAWVVSARYADPFSSEHAPADAGTGGIRAYNIDTGALLATYEIDERPVLHGFNDLAVGSDGSVYVTDTATNSIYELAARARRLRLLVHDDVMTFPNGIALSPDEHILYVAHVEGISAIDPKTGTRTLLSLPRNSAVGSIDGLLTYKGDLIGVQTSPYLDRIIRIELRRGGRAVRRVYTINSRFPSEYSETTVAVDGDTLYAVGGAPAADPYGAPVTAKPNFQVWKLPLR